MSVNVTHTEKMHPPAGVEAAIARIVTFFETLTPQSVTQLDLIYSPQASFKDPFNEVQGITPIQHVFEHMFTALHEPCFIVTTRVIQGQHCFLTWDFLFYFKSFEIATRQTVRGASHLVLDTQGRITLHRDYWDVAEELYEKIPVLGGLMRFVKKRARH